MGRIGSYLKRVRLVYRRSNTLTRGLILSAIVVSMAILLALHLSISAAQDHTEDLADKAGRLEQENQQLEENIDGLGSADSVEQIAKDELGLVDPDTTIIDPAE